MRVVFYSHSLVSDWNHGNAHFQRGVLRELEARGHSTLAVEPRGGWSRSELVKDQGLEAIDMFEQTFPELKTASYGERDDHEQAVDGADLVIVHEWTDPKVIAELGRIRREGGRFILLFNDTHHRAVSTPKEIDQLDLDGYDGILAFGEVLRETYLTRGWGRRVFTWHEAADIRLFRPQPDVEKERDIVWIGNWGDGERQDELETFLFSPVRDLNLSGTAHGVRYPQAALQALDRAGLEYRGWVASAGVPQAFARHRMTVHVPRRFYSTSLPGIPTIRMFEALACGIPLISAPWSDSENLFRSGRDFLFARKGDEMKAQMRRVLYEEGLAEELARSGLETILARHTCAHRVDELLDIVASLRDLPATNALETA